MRDKEHKRKYDKQYYQRTADKRRARYKVYYQKVREKKLAANKDWMAKNKAYRKEYAWELLLKNKYGITPSDYDTLYKSQNGCCAICGIHQTELKKRLYVDHDHSTGKVRALLCVNCNMLIGHAQEKVEILEKSIGYLKKYGVHQ